MLGLELAPGLLEDLAHPRRLGRRRLVRKDVEWGAAPAEGLDQPLGDGAEGRGHVRTVHDGGLHLALVRVRVKVRLGLGLGFRLRLMLMLRLRLN